VKCCLPIKDNTPNAYDRLSRAQDSVDERIFVSVPTSLSEVIALWLRFPIRGPGLKSPAPNTYRGSIAIDRPLGSLDDDSQGNQSACMT
jgi:hypothetical protein